MSLTDFGKLAGWSPELIESAKFILEEFETIETLVKEVGAEFIRFFDERYLVERDLASQVNFPAIEALRDDSRVADLAALIGEMLKLSSRPLSFRFEYHGVLLELYPSDTFLQSGNWKNRAEEALRTGLGGRFASRPDGDYVQEFWQTIEDYFNAWKNSSLSPYTSIVAPMGTGKTRTLEEFAQRGLCYVSYFNAGAKKSFTSPNRSLMAERHGAGPAAGGINDLLGVLYRQHLGAGGPLPTDGHHS